MSNSYYIVKEGDSLSEIANRFNLPSFELRLINGLSNNRICAGQNLRVCAKKVYEVRHGDSLNSICKRFGILEAKLGLVNNIDGLELYEGQRLIINDPIVEYIVKKGDDIQSIAQKHNILELELIEYNELHNGELFIGQILFVKNPLIVQEPNYFYVLVNKNFTLPSEFVPEKLVVPNVPFPFEYFHEKKLMRDDAAKALELLFKQAKEEGIDLYALSGYRSYSRQKFIFESSVEEAGFERTNKLSAKPGNSEHQTGLAMDVTSPSINYGLDQSFENTKEGQWIKCNAHKYGFILRYLEGKEHITGYVYEPWHIRYVGEEMARIITEQGITFEEYLGIE